MQSKKNKKSFDDNDTAANETTLQSDDHKNKDDAASP